MQDDSLGAHADSFRAGADRYDEHRPSYPPDTVRWLLGDARDVLDLGAGTGKLTAELVRLGARVTAVDPSADMLRVLHERMPDVATRVGSGERIPLADASVDLVTVAQAWHWVDPATTSAEVLRVLRPTGRLALIWNSRDESVDWVAELSEAMHPGLHELGRYVPPLGAGLAFTGNVRIIGCGRPAERASSTWQRPAACTSSHPNRSSRRSWHGSSGSSTRTRRPAGSESRCPTSPRPGWPGP